MIKTCITVAFFMCIMPKPAYSSEHFSDHEQYCLNQAAENCLELISNNLLQAQPKSTNWYKLKSYQLDYFYDTLNYNQIIKQIEPLIDDESLPSVFKSQLYFYYAKALNGSDNNELAQVYADKAIAKLEDMYQAFENPLRLVELANLHYVFGNKELAYQILLSVGNRYSKSRDAIFNFELNSNKANVLHAWGDFNKAAKFRKLALDWISNSDHQTKIIIAQGNLARTYQLAGKYELAINYYLASLSYMDGKESNVHYPIYLLRLAETHMQMGSLALAAKNLKQVNKQGLKAGHLALYTKLDSALSNVKIK